MSAPNQPSKPSALPLAPGDWVRHPGRPDWGIGQIQSIIGERITANFEHAGKLVINAALVSLQRAEEA